MQKNDNLDLETKDKDLVSVADDGNTDNLDLSNISNDADKIIDPATQKHLLITPLGADFKAKLNKLCEDLAVLRLDIFNKRNGIAAKRDLIKEKLDFLDESKKIRVDKSEIERTEKSAKSYIQLLDGIVHELGGEIAYYKLFASDEKPPIEKVVVPIKSPDNLEDYIQMQVNGVKKYLKNVKRDISISFSRYSYGFDEQLKRLTFIESYLKAKEAAAEKRKKDGIDDLK